MVRLVDEEDLQGLVARLEQRFATKEEMNNLREEARIVERTLNKLEVQMENATKALQNIENNIGWFVKGVLIIVLGAVVGLVVNV